jgi:hypothetical protein
MELPKKTEVIVGLIILAVGVAGGYAMTPTKIEVREKIVEKKVESTEKKRDRELVKVQIKRPDGTVETRTELKDKTEQKTDSTTENSKESEKIVSKGTGLGVQFFVRGPLNEPVYGAGVYKKILGPVSIGVFGFTDKAWGLSAGLEF